MTALASSTPANFGQQVTMAAATAYAGIKLPLGWATANRPNAPIVVTIQTGAGSLTGAGSTVATGSLPVSALDAADLTDIVVPFTAVYTNVLNVQAFVRFSCAGTIGWNVPVLDTRSNTVSGTTAAEVQGASQGGTTDSFFTGGVEDDRFDIPVAFIASPAAPTGFTVTPVAELRDSSGRVLRPAYNALSWTATALTTAFGGINIYRRPARAVAGNMVKVGAITVPTGYTRATVEAQHTRWRDYEAGWALTNGTWAEGWDYTITVVNATTGLESAFATLDGRNVVPVETPWVVSNGQPYLNSPLEVLQAISMDEPVRRTVHQTADTDYASVRTDIRRPPRSVSATFEPFAETGWDQLRVLEAAQESGNNVCLHTRLGDRVIGPLALTGSGGRRVRRLPTGLNIIETSRDLTSVADYNVPAGLVLDGTNDHITHGDITDPGSSAFTFMCAARFPSATVVPLSKGNVGAPGDGYMFITTAGAFSATIDGASAQASVSESSVVWFDGNVHVAACSTSGTMQRLYRDGTQVHSASTTHGAVSNNVALTVGAYNGGASLFAALAPLRAYALWYRELTAAEVKAASYYLLGYPGYRMPAGTLLFVDLRDDRCWDGISTSVVDLSGNGLVGTLTGGPLTRGIPWDLSVLEAS